MNSSGGIRIAELETRYTFSLCRRATRNTSFFTGQASASMYNLITEIPFIADKCGNHHRSKISRGASCRAFIIISKCHTGCSGSHGSVDISGCVLLHRVQFFPVQIGTDVRVVTRAVAGRPPQCCATRVPTLPWLSAQAQVPPFLRRSSRPCPTPELRDDDLRESRTQVKGAHAGSQQCCEAAKYPWGCSGVRNRANRLFSPFAEDNEGLQKNLRVFVILTSSA